jgi:RsiW-degrading membrane proteinase PrsW (M82 family)
VYFRQLRYRRRAIRLWTPVIVIVATAAIVGGVWWSLLTRNATPSERAERVAQMGDLETAERVSWDAVEANPNDVDAWVRFIDIDAAMRDGEDISTDPTQQDSRVRVSDAAVRDALKKTTNADVRTIATYWYDAQAPAAKPDAAAITALANRNPPARLANALLGRAAREADDWRTAAQRFEREGLSFANHRDENLRRAMSLWVHHEAWPEVRKRANDPRYRGVYDASVRLDLATHDRNWPAILLWLWPATYRSTRVWPVVLALLAAVLWYIIATRLGRAQDDVPGRRGLYALAFALGILSVYPTLLMLVVEEPMLGFQSDGQPVTDAIYFIFGVGLREELSKLLLFLPLLPALKRRASRIEAMTCGALVGLGFAAEENIAYFHEASAGVALARFLTANFLHMALTSLLALSVYDASRGRSTPRDGFNIIFPLVIGIHGVYDLFLENEAFSRLSLVSMILLVLLTQRFLRQLLIATSTTEQEGVLRLFVASMALLTGASYVYATTLVGPLIAIRLIALGVLGVAFVMYVFVRELGTT